MHTAQAAKLHPQSRATSVNQSRSVHTFITPTRASDRFRRLITIAYVNLAYCRCRPSADRRLHRLVSCNVCSCPWPSRMTVFVFLVQDLESHIVLSDLDLLPTSNVWTLIRLDKYVKRDVWSSVCTRRNGCLSAFWNNSGVWDLARPIS